jgi:deoxyadenosine/deoxycytidine kinase
MDELHAFTNVLEKELPEFKVEAELTEQEKKRINFFHTIIQFSNYTERMMLSKNFKQVKKCLQIAEQIYKKGDEMIKVSFEHIFIPRLHLELHDQAHNTARTMLPFCLMRTYLLLYNHKYELT